MVSFTLPDNIPRWANTGAGSGSVGKKWRCNHVTNQTLVNVINPTVTQITLFTSQLPLLESIDGASVCSTILCHINPATVGPKLYFQSLGVSNSSNNCLAHKILQLELLDQRCMVQCYAINCGVYKRPAVIGPTLYFKPLGLRDQPSNSLMRKIQQLEWKGWINVNAVLYKQLLGLHTSISRCSILFSTIVSTGYSINLAQHQPVMLNTLKLGLNSCINAGPVSSVTFGSFY